MIGTNKRKIITLLLVLVLSALTFSFSPTVLAEDLSGDEILARMDRQTEVVTQGELMSILTFNNQHADGTTSSYQFGALA